MAVVDRILGSSGMQSQSVGGQRTTVRRRSTGSFHGKPNSVKSRQGSAVSAGLLKFYTDDSPGFKVGPQTVLVLTLIFMGTVVVLHIFGKFRQAYDS